MANECKNQKMIGMQKIPKESHNQLGVEVRGNDISEDSAQLKHELYPRWLQPQRTKENGNTITRETANM